MVVEDNGCSAKLLRDMGPTYWAAINRSSALGIFFLKADLFLEMTEFAYSIHEQLVNQEGVSICALPSQSMSVRLYQQHGGDRHGIGSVLHGAGPQGGATVPWPDGGLSGQILPCLPDQAGHRPVHPAGEGVRLFVPQDKHKGIIPIGLLLQAPSHMFILPVCIGHHRPLWPCWKMN
eukprot:scaffold105964_cov24-Prasinocladus_malaysianus.AAC.1